MFRANMHTILQSVRAPFHHGRDNFTEETMFQTTHCAVLEFSLKHFA